MASARTYTIAKFAEECRYELRDTGAKQWTPEEFVAYLNKCEEFIYYLLVDAESELLTIGTGTLTTVAGTETYSLATNSMGDFWAPRSVDPDDPPGEKRYWVHISTYDMMTMCAESDRIPYAMAEEDSDTTLRDIPTQFYIQGDNIGFLPIPNDAYAVLFQYWPNYLPSANTTIWVTATAYVAGDRIWISATDTSYYCVTAHTSNVWATDLAAGKWAEAYMPYKNLFNQEIKQAILATAKNRQHYASPLDAVTQAMFAEKAHSIRRKRIQRVQQLTPAVQFR